MNGAKTLILESRSQFGGTATAAHWMCMNWLFINNNETMRGGVHNLVVKKLQEMGEFVSRPGKRQGGIFNGCNF